MIAYAAAYEYAQVEDMLEAAREKGEPPFLFLLDGVEDPHNLGAIIPVSYTHLFNGFITLLLLFQYTIFSYKIFTSKIK